MPRRSRTPSTKENDYPMSNRRRRRPGGPKSEQPGIPDPIITDPQDYNEAEHATIKLLALALVDADLAHDEARKLAMLPGPHVNDLGNVIDVLTRICAALVRS